MIKTKRGKQSRIEQGDIIKDVDYIENIFEKAGNIEISKVRFPLVIVLTQDCDLAQDYKFRYGIGDKTNHDKFMFSVLVAPIYNADHFFEGKHLELLKQNMQSINKKKSNGQFITNNENPRYHYLEFPEPIPIVPSIIDFKHYFSVNVDYLKSRKRSDFICKVSELYREQITLRFSNFLSRIPLPD
ncbi:MAG: hypothetical protein WCI71_18550 [Bacteroidota bacterium]